MSVTKVVKHANYPAISAGFSHQLRKRTCSLDEWLTDPELSDRLSGTLRKNARLGFRYHDQLVSEAIAQTLGWCFECLPTTYITYNDALSEGDCHSVTEAGWHFDRLLKSHIFAEDVFILQYVNIQDAKGNIERQGIAIITKETSIQWIPKGNLVFAMLSEFNQETQEWLPCENPF